MNIANPEFSPKYRVSLHEEHCEVHFSISGFWDLSSFDGFLADVDEAAFPLVKARKPIYALGDFDGFVPQDRKTGEIIRDHLMEAKKHGLLKIAIVSGSPLVKMQYRRLSQGLEVEFFDGKAEALAWLRTSA